MSCNPCNVQGGFSISGGLYKDGIHATADSNFTAINPDFKFNDGDKWVGAAIDGLTAHIELDIDLIASNQTNELVVPLYTAPSLITGVCYDSYRERSITNF